MKRKIVISTILIVLATVSSFAILNADGYFNNKSENKVLATEVVSLTPVVLAKETTPIKTPVVAKKPIPVKKTVAKKVIPKKKIIRKKSKLNLNPAPFTSETAPYSAKNKYN